MGLVKISNHQAGFRRGFCQANAGENRASRRKAVKRAGGDWRREQRAKRHADEMDTTALRMSPDEARRTLAAWAARPCHTQAEVDVLNGRADNG